MDKNLGDPDLCPVIKWTNENLDPDLELPVFLAGLLPVMEAEHYREGVGRQHLLLVVVVQAVSCCQGESVSNLR